MHLHLKFYIAAFQCCVGVDLIFGSSFQPIANFHCLNTFLWQPTATATAKVEPVHSHIGVKVLEPSQSGTQAVHGKLKTYLSINIPSYAIINFP